MWIRPYHTIWDICFLFHSFFSDLFHWSQQPRSGGRLVTVLRTLGKWSRSVLSDSLRPHGLQSTRLSIHGIFQARILEWVAISFSRGSSRPRDRTRVFRIVGRHFYCLSHQASPTWSTLNKSALFWASPHLFSLGSIPPNHAQIL